ncbi:MAG: ice-binding family protein [Solirubrobacteraceae bacterium]
MLETLNRRTDGRLAGSVVALTFAVVSLLVSSAHAASPVALGTADSFALLAGSTITNTGATSITGDIGLCCTGVATAGFGPGANQVSQPGGAQYTGTGTVAATAQDDLDIAYLNAAGQAVTNTVPVDLSLSGTPASPLLPGVYESVAHGALQINTGLTLDFQGDPNAVFIFQGTTLSTAVAAGGSVNIVNGGATPSSCNIYWQLSDATQGVTLGTSSAFKGTTMALGASVLGTGATVQGRILTRRSKAVNLDTNTITRSACFVPGGGAAGGGPTTPTPTPTTVVAPTTPSATPPVSSTPGSTGGSPQTIAAPSGRARLSGPMRPVRGPFTVSVTGRAIQSVTFYVDGRRRATVRARPGRKKFTLRINPRRQSHRVHRVTARVTFTPASRTARTTLRVTYRRARLVRRAPRFTG